jgi:predicted TIM-barrel fold metal-dependent hydrolase
MTVPVTILDGHVHLLGEDSEAYLAALLAAMDRNGVGRAVVFGFQLDLECPDLLALSAVRRWPDRFAPFTCAVDPDDADSPSQLEHRLSSEPWAGVGELFLATDAPSTAYRTRAGRKLEYRYPVPASLADGSVFHQVLEMCADYRKPVLIHSDDANVLGDILSRHPDVTFIWAHADWCLHEAGRLLTRHPNLVVEIGTHLHFGGLAAPGQPIEQAPYMADWLALCLPFIEDHVGRVTYGSDHFEWRHLEPDVNADAGYSAVRQVCRWLSPSAAHAWLWDTLSSALE